MRRKRVRGARRPARLGLKGTPVTTPMSYERRLASYGLRDPDTGVTTGQQSGPQRRRIRHKIGHVSRAAEVRKLAGQIAADHLPST